MTRPGGAAKTEVEDGVDLVRLVLALIASAVAVGTRTSADDIASGLLTVAIITLVAIQSSLVRRLIERTRTPKVIKTTVSQCGDTAATVGLVIVVGGLAPDSAWVLLAIPIVISSLRHTAIGVLVTWAAASAGYLTVLRFDLIEPGPDAFETALVVEQPGTLLALAAAVAVMTRWLRQGWEHQATTTHEVEQHLNYVRAIEQAGRAMRQTSREQVTQITTDNIIKLGFEAATQGTPNDNHPIVGDPTAVPAQISWPTPEPGVVEVTDWTTAGGHHRYSASIIEPRTGRLLTGWSTTDPTRHSLEALADLIAYSTASIELADLLEAAQREAHHDPLTSLHNRAGLRRHLEHITNEPQEVALLFIDVDYFKQINDTHGHQIGDAVLVGLASSIRSVLPATAIPARFGGDEFVIVLYGPDAAHATAIARTLWEYHQQPVTIDGTSLDVRLSIGVAAGHAPLDPTELAHRADEALYQAKEAGRNTVRTHRRHQQPPEPGRAQLATITDS